MRYLYKVYKGLVSIICSFFGGIFTNWILYINGIKREKGFKSNGIPIINVNLRGAVNIGINFTMNNGNYYNTIGRQQQCYIIVGEFAKLSIGDNVGISCTAIICKKKIVIGNNVMIGGNTVIYDTDFHNLDSTMRAAIPEDHSSIKMKDVIIEDNVFIGAHVTILKGVRIGKNSIIGACSLVTKSIPENEIWGGNPAKFIKKIITVS